MPAFWNPFRRRRQLDALYMELVAVHLSVRHTRNEIMAKIDDLSAQVDALAAALSAEEAKSTAVIALLTTIEQQLAQASGTGGASPDQLDALNVKITALLGQVNAAAAADDAALASAPATPPAPAPAP